VAATRCAGSYLDETVVAGRGPIATGRRGDRDVVTTTTRPEGLTPGGDREAARRSCPQQAQAVVSCLVRRRRRDFDRIRAIHWKRNEAVECGNARVGATTAIFILSDDNRAWS